MPRFRHGYHRAAQRKGHSFQSEDDDRLDHDLRLAAAMEDTSHLFTEPFPDDQQPQRQAGSNPRHRPLPPGRCWSDGSTSPVSSPSPPAMTASAEEDSSVSQQFLVNLINLSKLNMESP